MTREEFIQLLDSRRKRYDIEGDNIIITCEGPLSLSLPVIPDGVIFKNSGFVSLGKGTRIHPGVEFHNSGVVILDFKGLYYIHNWLGNIEGIKDNRLLNLMIKKGLFY